MTVEALDALLDLIYTAADDQRHWDKVLSSLASNLSACGGALHLLARDGSSFSFGVGHGVDPGSLSAYADHFYSVNPLNTALSCIAVGAAVPDHHLVPRRELERTEFYNDFARLYDIAGSITLVLARDDRHEACLGIVRDVRSDLFTSEEVSFVQRLGPHILRAVSLNRKLASAAAERYAFEAALDQLEAAVFRKRCAVHRVAA